ncbi:MAG: PAS domain S-box protein [Chloroflexi bacterium]|nr:PAS domain S-box protein [Chloroflexota bacterium]
MKDTDKTKEQLVKELELLRQRVAKLEAAQAECERIAEELRSSAEEFSSSLLENSPNPILVINADTSIRYVNTAFEQLTDFSAAELIGRKAPYPWWTEATPHKSQDDIKEAMSKGMRKVEEVFKKKNGEQFWAEVTSIPVSRGGEIQYYLTIWVDITERRRLEERIRHHNLVLRAIRNINQLIARGADRDSLLKGACDNFVKTRGYSDAWIVLLDDSGKFVTVAEAGLGKDFKPLVEQLRRGKLPDCARKALQRPDIVIIEDRSSCADCSLAKAYEYGGRMSIRLGCGGKVYGLLSASRPSNITIDEEELALFDEIAGDIAFSLFSMEQQEERKKAEAALRQSEKRYRTILEEMQDTYFEVDIAGNLTFGNRAFYLSLGYSPDEMLGMNYRVYTAAEDVKAVYRVFNQVYLRGEPARNFTFKVIRKDGSTGYAELSISPLRDEKGEIVGFRGNGRDVTERMQMEEILRQSEERFRVAAASISDAVWEWNVSDGTVLWFGDIDGMLGYGPGEFPRTLEAWGNALHPDDHDRVMTALQRGVDGVELYDVEYRVLTKDGSVRYWTDRGMTTVRDEMGRSHIMVGACGDITERKQMEEALRRSEERYRTVLEEMEEAYYETDLAGNFTFFNNALCQKSGYSREELMGMNYRVYIPPKYVKKVFSAYNQVYRTGELLKWFPMENIRKDGTRIFVEDSIFPLRNERGDIIGFRGVSRDVTGRMQAEEERRQLEQKAQLAGRLASVGEMASGIAHEINNPLTGVIGYAHLLLDRKDIPVDIRQDVEIIHEGAQRVASIVSRMLAFARQYKPERKWADINELIGSTLYLRAYHLETSNIKVTTQLASDLPITIADPGQLQQVFLNLIVNAEMEMKLAHGGGKLSIKIEQVDNTIRISFKDNGPGIAKENLEKIFDPFFTTREVGQGTGLGLSVCHGIITEHKGKIWVESKLGRGATFIVELPIVTEDSQLVLLEPTAKEPKKVTKAKILVVDDELVIRQFVSRVLSEEGHEVEAVDKAEDALERIKSKRYRLILLDIKMPGISGIELYKQFQEIAPSLAKRVVFITGDVIGARTTVFLTKAKMPYIMKPFDAKQLKTEIKRILARE